MRASWCIYLSFRAIAKMEGIDGLTEAKSWLGFRYGWLLGVKPFVLVTTATR
jgi:hypothetical protein